MLVEVSRALHQFVFECVRLTSVDDTGAFSTAADLDVRQLDIPWDDPYPYYAGMIPVEAPDDDPLRCAADQDDAVPPPSPDLKTGRQLGVPKVGA